MKKTIHTSVSLLLAFLCVLCLASCGNRVDATGLWEDATYLSDKTFGDGASTILVEVKAEEQSVTFTVKHLFPSAPRWICDSSTV